MRSSSTDNSASPAQKDTEPSPARYPHCVRCKRLFSSAFGATARNGSGKQLLVKKSDFCQKSDFYLNVEWGMERLRSAEKVMPLKQLGAMHQTRLSFVRTLIRKLLREQWHIERTQFDLDGEGYGTAVYTVTTAPDEVYSLVVFSNYLDDALRTDRVIAEQWDVAFVLCVGRASQAQIAELRVHVPRQEAGRFLPYVLVLSRANKSTRNFDYVLDQLANGRQPDPQRLIKVGYLYRTTAVYGNGKFGIADYDKVQQGAFAASFRAQMFAVFMMRHFAVEQVEWLAQQRNPAQAVRLAEPIARYLGVGNATGLGMAPFLVTHPQLLNQWLWVRETALARCVTEGAVTAKRVLRFRELVARASQHVSEIETIHPLQQMHNQRMMQELGALEDWLDSAPEVNWSQLIDYAETDWCEETQEVVNSVLLEVYPELVDDLGDSVNVEERLDLRPAMPIADLRDLIEQKYDWVLAIDFDEQAAQQWFWYRSAEKEEPRLGNRYEEAGAEKEQRLDIARQVRICYDLLSADCAAFPNDLTIDFLLRHPTQRGIVRRIQSLAHLPYAEIRANLLDAECLPIHLLRCKLAMFGASKFDPRSNLWVRITLFQGAPLVSDIGRITDDDWFWPIAP